MSLKRIGASQDPATILLPRDVLEEMGVCEGDEVDVSVLNHTVTLRPLTDRERTGKVEDATDAVFERRSDAYRKLAEGVE